MEATIDIFEKHKKLLLYVEEKIGIPVSFQKKEIKNHIQSLLKNPESGFTRESSEKRYEGIIYEYIIGKLLKIKNAEDISYDYLHDGKEIEFKTAFDGTLPIKGKLVGQKIMPYESAKEIYYITNKEPPFTIYKISRDYLFELINSNSLIKKYKPGEMAGYYEKVICVIPTYLLKKEIVSQI